MVADLTVFPPRRHCRRRRAEATSLPGLRRLCSEGAELAAAALAPATWQAYGNHFRWWWRFLVVFGLTGYLMRPTEGVLFAYVAFLARTCTAASIKQYLKGLRYVYAGLGVAVPWRDFAQLDRAIAGLRRLRGEATHRKLPITPPILAAFATHLPPGSRWHATLVCCVLGVFGMLRRSNLVVGALSLAGQPKHITRGDVTFDRSRYALKINVRFAKNLQFQDRVHQVWVQGDPSPRALIDPVRMWLSYVNHFPAPPTAPALLFHDAHGNLTPLNFSLLAEGIKTLVAATGRDPSRYASHSLRRGGATYAVQAGADPFFVQMAGDWASASSFQLYVQLGAESRLSCTAAMLSQLRRER